MIVAVVATEAEREPVAAGAAVEEAAAGVEAAVGVALREAPEAVLVAASRSAEMACPRTPEGATRPLPVPDGW
jgi:hypothetical protein